MTARVTRVTVAGEAAIDRLITAVDQELRAWNNVRSESRAITAPTLDQVAVVLHALADYTALRQALIYTDSGNPARNIGRWLHALADDAEKRL